jgi:hypothetical protein
VPKTAIFIAALMVLFGSNKVFLVLFGSIRCRMAKRSAKSKVKTFSMRLQQDDYRKLKALAEENKPKLTVQYVAEFAVLKLLERAETERLDLANPLSKNRPK